MKTSLSGKKKAVATKPTKPKQTTKTAVKKKVVSKTK
jgi:hypothetical protein